MLGVQEEARVHDPAFVIFRFPAPHHVEEVRAMGAVRQGRDVVLVLPVPLVRRHDARGLNHLVERVTAVARGGMLDAVLDVARHVGHDGLEKLHGVGAHGESADHLTDLRGNVPACPHPRAPRRKLRLGREPLVQEEVDDLFVVGVGRKVLDGVPTIIELALLAVDAGNGRLIRNDSFETS